MFHLCVINARDTDTGIEKYWFLNLAFDKEKRLISSTNATVLISNQANLMLFNYKLMLTCRWHFCQNFTQCVNILNFPSGEWQVVGVSKSCFHWCVLRFAHFCSLKKYMEKGFDKGCSPQNPLAHHNVPILLC